MDEIYKDSSVLSELESGNDPFCNLQRGIEISIVISEETNDSNLARLDELCQGRGLKLKGVTIRKHGNNKLFFVCHYVLPFVFGGVE